MCAPISDGAAAAVVCTADAAASLRPQARRRIAALALVSGQRARPEDWTDHIGRRAAAAAYAQAGLDRAIRRRRGSRRLAFAEILQIENLGLLRAGAGGPTPSAARPPSAGASRSTLRAAWFQRTSDRRDRRDPDP